MSIVFLGSQEIGASSLESLLDLGVRVTGYSSFEPEVHEQWGGEVRAVAERWGIPDLGLRQLRDPHELERLREVRPHLVVVVGWRWLIPRSALSVPLRGAVAVHGSLLPRLRGFAPVNWALIRDETRSGVTLFELDEGMDTGKVIAQRSFPITDDDDAGTVRARVARLTVDIVAQSIPKFLEGAVALRPQVGEPTYGARRRPEDGRIDWGRPGREIFNLVRGTTRPYPGAFSEWDGNVLRIWKVQETNAPMLPVGRVRLDDEQILVGTADHPVRIVDAQLEATASNPVPFGQVLRALGTTESRIGS